MDWTRGFHKGAQSYTRWSILGSAWFRTSVDTLIQQCTETETVCKQGSCVALGVLSTKDVQIELLLLKDLRVSRNMLYVRVWCTPELITNSSAHRDTAMARFEQIAGGLELCQIRI